MDPVNGISQIVQILRRKLADRATPRVAGDATSMAPDRAPAQKASAEEVRRKISARIQRLTIEERKGPRAAQIFVESIIAWEFGDEVLQDPKFADLAKEVFDTIAADAQISARLKTLLGQM